MKIVPTFDRERAHGGIVAGVDEAGRGPLAGPVVAAAVVLDPARIPDGIGDSKKLTAKQRERLFGELFESARIGVGQASVEEIDTINILRASHLAMVRAVEALPCAPELVLVDGNMAPAWAWRCETLVGGDSICLSVAAASIVAKVTRDRLMAELHEVFPAYGWASNMGYGSRAHLEALTRFGATPHHRQSFRPVAELQLACV